MTEPTLEEMAEAFNNQKKSHAQEMVVKIDELVALAEAHPELWFGGLPPSFVNVRNMSTSLKRSIQDDFSLTDTP